MKKTFLLLLIFVLLGGAAYLFTQQKEKTSKSTVLGWDRKFKVENENDIHKIFIVKRTGAEPTTLVRNGEYWTYNEKYRVRPSVMDNVLEVLTNIRMHSIPPNSAVDNIVDELGAQGIKIEVYDQNNTQLKVFYLGGVTTDGRATYAIMEGSEQPFVIEIPRMEGSLRTRFDLEKDQWRDRAVFRTKIADIQSVSVEYPKQRNKSFVLSRTDNGYNIKPFYNITTPINKPLSIGEVEAFLMGFDAVIAENFVNNVKKQDSIANTIPFVVYKIKRTDGTERQATLFLRDNVSQTGIVRSEVAERYWAAVSERDQRDFMLVQQRVFSKILWAYEFFFEGAR
jgi:hypothetical protein